MFVLCPIVVYLIKNEKPTNYSVYLILDGKIRRYKNVNALEKQSAVIQVSREITEVSASNPVIAG